MEGRDCRASRVEAGAESATRDRADSEEAWSGELAVGPQGRTRVGVHPCTQHTVLSLSVRTPRTTGLGVPGG